MLRSLLLVLSVLILSACSSGGKKESMKDSSPKEAAKSEKSMKTSPEKIQTKTSGGVTQSSTQCEVEGDQRTIEVVAEGRGCVLFYSKFGERKEVASGSWSTEHCEKIRDRIVGNLEEANFSCKAAK